METTEDRKLEVVDPWGIIEAPQYLDFGKGVSEPHDSFFDFKKHGDVPSENFEAQKLPGMNDEDLKLTTTLKNLSISQIEQDSRQWPEICGTSTSTPFSVPGVRPIALVKTNKHDLNNNNNGNFSTWPKDVRPHATIPKPFSFAERDKQLQERKQRRIKRILEEEKKARIFHANPVPKFLKTSTTTGSLFKPMTRNNDAGFANWPSFKAKPPKVLYVPPFEPLLSKQHVTVPQPPRLNTEIRAKARERFQNQLKEKEEENEHIKKLRAAAEKKREEEEITRLRKEMVHRANPVRRYKFVAAPVVKRPLTEPTTPMMTGEWQESAYIGSSIFERCVACGATRKYRIQRVEECGDSDTRGFTTFA